MAQRRGKVAGEVVWVDEGREGGRVRVLTSGPSLMTSFSTTFGSSFLPDMMLHKEHHHQW
jgi:hypothetical protein